MWMECKTECTLLPKWGVLRYPSITAKHTVYRLFILHLYFDVEYIYGFIYAFVWWGVCKQSRWRHSVTVPHTRWRMFYYGNVMTTTRWRLYVTMETLRQQQDGGYALLWKRYPNIQITSTFAVEDVYIEFVIDVFYIFNSTVIDWTCLCTVFFYPAHLSYILTALQKQLLT